MDAIDDTLAAAGTPIPALSDREQALEAGWRMLTEAGNQAGARSRHAEALRCHAEALLLAEQLMDEALAGGSPLLAPMLLNISHANIAQEAVRVGDGPAGRDRLLLVFERLIGLAGMADTPLALRINCVRHLRHTLGMLASQLPNGISGVDMPRLFERWSAMARMVGEVTTADRGDRRHEPRSALWPSASRPH